MRAAEAAVTRHNKVRNGRVSPNAPTLAAARTRRYRERRKKGAVLIEISVYGPALDDLVALGWLDPERRGDRDAVRSAVVRLARHALALGFRADG
jgi:hypothetical protein